MKNLSYLITLFILSGCLILEESAPYPYGFEINPLREKIGLQIIDSTFTSYNSKSVSTFDKVNKIFYSPHLSLNNKHQKPLNEPSYFEKYIELNKHSGKLIFEEDIYRSGFYKYGFIEESDIFEVLKFKYVFEEHESYFVNNLKHAIDTVVVTQGWHFIYEFPVEIAGVNSNKLDSIYWKRETINIMEEKADSILNSWGLKRFKAK